MLNNSVAQYYAEKIVDGVPTQVKVEEVIFSFICQRLNHTKIFCWDKILTAHCPCVWLYGNDYLPTTYYCFEKTYVTYVRIM